MQKNVVGLGLIFLCSCSHLSEKLSAYREKKSIRVATLSTLKLTESPGFQTRGGMGVGRRKIRSLAPWQWRGNDALGAPQQSFLSPQFLGGEDLLVTTLGGGVGLLDLHSGHFRWKLDVAIGVSSKPVVVGSSVYVAGMDAVVRKLKLSTGKLEWESKVSAESLGGIVQSQGFLYVTTGDDALWALDEKTGQNLWTYKRPSPEGSMYWSLRGNAVPALSPDGTKLYVGFSDGTFVCLEASSGHTVWERKFDRAGRFKDADTNPILSNDGQIIYLAIVDGDFVALKATDGTTLWAVPGAAAAAPDVDEVGGAIYVATSDSQIQRLSLKDASIVWTLNLKARGLGSTPVRVGASHLAVSTSHGGVLILNRKTGKIVWERQLGYGSLAPPAYDGRRLVVLSARNYLLVHRVDELSSSTN